MVKILIVDDEKDFLFVLKNILKKNGFDVESHETGDAVFQKVEEYKPNIVLLDIALDNGFDGRQICREIKNGFDKPPAIFLCSGHLRRSDLGSDYEGDDFIEKPIRVPELLQKITLHAN